MAVILAALVALGVLAVATALSAQATRGRNVIDARTLATRWLERSQAGACGLQTGAESAAVLAPVYSRCATLLGLSGSSVVGDVAGAAVFRGTNYTLAVTHRWLRHDDAASAASTCAAVSAVQPVALERTVTVSWLDKGTTANTYTAVAASALPADSAAYESNFGGIVVTDLAEGDAVDLIALHDSSLRIRRTAAMLSSGGTGCVWFPYLPADDYSLAMASSSASTVVTVGSSTVTVAKSVLPQ